MSEEKKNLGVVVGRHKQHWDNKRLVDPRTEQGTSLVVVVVLHLPHFHQRSDPKDSSLLEVFDSRRQRERVLASLRSHRGEIEREALSL